MSLRFEIFTRELRILIHQRSGKMRARKLVWIGLSLRPQLGQLFATLRDIAVFILLWVCVTLLSVAVLVHFNTCCRYVG